MCPWSLLTRGHRGDQHAARRAAAAAEALLDPGVPAELADPEAAAVDFSRAVASAFSEAGYDRSPEAAGAVLLKTASMLQS